MKYQIFTHHNSKTSRRRGLLQKFNALTGLIEKVDRTTRQFFRSPDNGDKLEHIESREVLRSYRSLYSPHVGAKQLRKLAAH